MISTISNNKALVICLTALNYVYAILDQRLGMHDVLCNEEVAVWLKNNSSDLLENIYIYDFQNKVLLINHFKKDFDRKLFEEMKEISYKSYYLSFSSGWHFNWLQKNIGLDIDKCIILDDGIGNIFAVKTRHYFIYNFLSTILFLKPKSFSRYRDFSNKYIRKVITIYSLEKSTNKNLEILNISNKLRKYCNDNLKKNKCYLNQKYGIYLTSDIAVYNNDRNKIIDNIKNNMKYLEDKTQLPWILKCKKTDPLKNFYQDLGYKVIDSINNLELIIDNNVNCVCTNYDTFLLNSLILNFPLNYYIRENEQTKQLWLEKKKFLRELLNKNGIKAIFIK